MLEHPLNVRPQWIGSPVDHRIGPNAAKALEDTNDIKYWNDETGISLVDEQRWKQAQRYEHDTWMRHGLASKDDRDRDHKINFGNYDILPGNLYNIVEIGCGPFTQTFNIIQGRKAESITLVDPLLNSYKSHPNCRYSKLQSTNSKQPTFKAIPAEDFQSKGFDTAICINVLEHVRDAAKVMENLVGCLKIGGWLIFHDRVYDGLDISKIYDVGHPIRVTRKFLEPYLKQFTPKFENNDYFIGVKKPEE